MWSFIFSALVFLLAGQVSAQEKKPAEKPGVVAVDATSITATVEAIDYDKRTIALKDRRATCS
jgi:hypothetical protein